MKVFRFDTEGNLHRTENQTGEKLKEIFRTYTAISITFQGTSIMEIDRLDDGLSGILLRERTVEEPFEKNYDDQEDPMSWLENWDTSNWILTLIQDDDQPIAGTLLAYKTTGVNMLRGRDDLMAIWDMRVNTPYRGRGIGRLLFHQTIDHAMSHGCNIIHVETQNTNAGACKFYHRMGCHLVRIDTEAYHHQPTETQLVWEYTIEY